MADPASEFQRLVEQRDLAAYRTVAAVNLVLAFFEAQDFEEAIHILERAHVEFQRADLRITEFHKSHTGENRHGHSSAA